MNGCRRAALAACVLLLSVPVRAQEAAPVGSPDPGWPQFRGPLRDGVSVESGLLQTWPEAGPPLLWTATGIGRGYSSPVVTDGRVIVTGDREDEHVLTALDLAGSVLWETTNGRSWTKSYPGARGTCNVRGDRVYQLNAHGRLACLETATGREIWGVDAFGDHRAPGIRWAASECPVVDGDRIYVCTGGPEALVVAYNRVTGTKVWSAPPLTFTRKFRFGGKAVDPPREDTDAAGYASPILFTYRGGRYLAGVSGRHMWVVDLTRRRLAWKRKIFARYEVIGAIPVLHENALLYAAPDDFGSRLFALGLDGAALTLTEQWENPSDNCHGGFVAANGRILGSGYRRSKAWVAIDPATGETRAEMGDLASGSCIWADGRLYALAQSGVLRLLELTDAGLKTRGEVRLINKPAKDVWAHPVVCDGRLYIRIHGELRCYDIRRK